MEEFGFVGQVDLMSTTFKAECGPCETDLPKGEPAFLYYDELGRDLILMCKECHLDPARAKFWMYQDSNKTHE